MTDAILSPADRRRVEQAVIEAEKRTAGEIVPMVVGRSDAYPGARWRLAVATGLLCAISVYVLLPHVDPIWYLVLQIPGMGLGWIIGSTEYLRYVLVSDRVSEEVHQRAVQAFFAHDLHTTRDRTGILIMVSLLERRAEILADAGINEKVPPGTWDGVVADLIARAKAGDLAGGLAAAVAACGELLAQHFPIQPDDTNELRNQLIVEE